jgi:hypothetical protein
MSSINKRFFILGFLLMFSMSTVFAGTFQSNSFNVAAFGKLGEASLITEKSDYLRGETVTIYGTGFGKFENISLSVEGYNTGLKQNVPLMQWNVYASNRGMFTASIPFDSLSSEGGEFVLRAVGSKTGTIAETNFDAVPENEAADIDQCANGPFSAPEPCTGSAWVNGNVGASKGHYFEGDSIPYRIKFSGLTIGSTNTVTIEWDTTKAGKHAIDYLTSYNRTESVGNDPCSGVAGCGAATTFPIPLDPNVAAAGVTQIGGQVFTMFGGTITSVSAYTLTGTYAGDSSTRITITFTANTTNPVLAWGGHIADRQDWAAQGGSASDISGSPYHSRILDLNGSGGNQDRSLSNVAVRLNTRIIIIKQAAPETAQVFGFSASGSGVANFTLVDDGVDNDATPNNITFNNLLAPAGSGAYSFTETANGFYDLTNLSCTVQAGGTSTFSPNIPTSTVNITLNYGDVVTCTFFNSVTTAANVSVSGRVMDAFGSPISRATVQIQNLSNGEIRSISTGSFGYYFFDELPSGDNYLVTVSHKRYTFSNSSSLFTLNDAIVNLDFTADLQ